MKRSTHVWLSALVGAVCCMATLFKPALAADTPQPILPTEGSYLGTENSRGACLKRYRIVGHAPAGAGRHPLFLYFVGTNISGNAAEAEDYQSATPLQVTAAMAARGYVAYSVQYDNGLATWLSNRKAVMRCLFDSTAQGGLLEQLCQQPGSGGAAVDCEKGITTWGHSLGGAIAISARNLAPRVRAAWATGVGGIKAWDGTPPALPPQRIRIVNGSKDAVPLLGWLIGNNNDTRRLSRELALTPAQDCPGQQHQCLRPDGSGWILVQPEELAPRRNPDHCWFYAMSCNQRSSFVEANFMEGRSRISIHENADWLVKAAATEAP